ncbi:KRAB-A domain-containing protein 2-like [Ranitomeya imitator]|uniref:KRAB-A domain-containing protein 2-like n=1 Tax=Ranitomeya imitator TaxID=111125 RepID=UPI0037E8BEF4
MSEEMKDRFSELLNEVVEKKRDNNFYLTDDKYENILKEVKEAKVVVLKQSIHYRRLKRYDIMTIGNVEKLIEPISCEKENLLHYVWCAELFSVIHNAHISTGHGGRTRILKEMNRKFKYVTTESIVIYLRLCQPCQKKQKITKKGLVVKPILHSEMNSRAQVDLIDMQSNCDNDFKFIFVYQDHVTKFVLLHALCTKTAEEVAYHLLDIFSTFGAPCILHSDNGREFCNKVIQNLCAMWPDMKIVHGKPRHSQSQGSVERANQDIENMLSMWMETNKSPKWSECLHFVQTMKNRAYHEGIKCSPFEAMFEVPMQMGVATSKIPSDGITNLSSEEDLEKMFVGLQEEPSDPTSPTEAKGSDDSNFHHTSAPTAVEASDESNCHQLFTMEGEGLDLSNCPHTLTAYETPPILPSKNNEALKEKSVESKPSKKDGELHDDPAT